jgi:hypothetical protein
VTRLISISGWRLRIADFSIRASSRRLLRFNVRRRVAREHPVALSLCLVPGFAREWSERMEQFQRFDGKKPA